jgi:hypothetical protein
VSTGRQSRSTRSEIGVTPWPPPTAAIVGWLVGWDLTTKNQKERKEQCLIKPLQSRFRFTCASEFHCHTQQINDEYGRVAGPHKRHFPSSLSTRSIFF